METKQQPIVVNSQSNNVHEVNEILILTGISTYLGTGNLCTLRAIISRKKRNCHKH